jgi:hypothetical protein
VVDDEDATSVSLAATGGGTEGQSITYTATLGAAAQADTFVTLSNGSVITIGSGASSGTVSVAARTDDSYDQGTTTVTASISSATGGNFETLTVSGGAASTTVVDDEDATSVSLAATGGGTEGQSITYTATLGAAAQADTFVTLSQRQRDHHRQRRQQRHGERGGAHGRQLRPGHDHGHGEHQQRHGRQLRDADGQRRRGQHHGGG